jgi:hypothetical protein
MCGRAHLALPAATTAAAATPGDLRKLFIQPMRYMVELTILAQEAGDLDLGVGEFTPQSMHLSLEGRDAATATHSRAAVVIRDALDLIDDVDELLVIGRRLLLRLLQRASSLERRGGALNNLRVQEWAREA